MINLGQKITWTDSTIAVVVSRTTENRVTVSVREFNTSPPLEDHTYVQHASGERSLIQESKADRRLRAGPFLR
jgi:hypothetical protein